jgi:hypothetical protein
MVGLLTASSPALACPQGRDEKGILGVSRAANLSRGLVTNHPKAVGAGPHPLESVASHMERMYPAQDREQETNLGDPLQQRQEVALLIIFGLLLSTVCPALEKKV